MKTALLLALLAHGLDSAQTCRMLKNGGIEKNPLLPQSCIGIIAVKGVLLTPLIPLRKNEKHFKIYAGVMAGSGAFGFTVSLINEHKK